MMNLPQTMDLGSGLSTFSPPPLTSADPPPMSDEDHCLLFQFVVDSLITGVICVFGFAGNTASFMTLWHEKISVSTFLLQAVIIADFVVLWMLFIGDAVPGLGFVIEVLENCQMTCRYVAMVTGPLLFLGQVCGIWLTLLALVDRYVMMCKPSHADVYCTLDTARKHVIVIIMLAVVITLPIAFDKGVFVDGTSEDGELIRQPLSDNYWYQLMYLNIVIMVAVYFIPIACQLYLTGRLAHVVKSVHRLRRSLTASYRLKHMDLTQLHLTITITMVICYTPTVIIGGFRWVQGHPQEECATLLYYLDSFSKVFLALNSSIKVILLCMFVKDFRAKLRASLLWVSCQKSKEMPESASEYNMYKCADMSEMTLISNVESRA